MSADPHLDTRIRMVREQIRARGITNERVLAVMEQVPRERFVPPEERADALSDQALSIGCGQTISQPYMVAIMTDCLELDVHHRVLELGTGSGYQTAILARLAGEIYTIERIPELQDHAHAVLEALGITNVFYRTGDGSTGWPQQAPFDRIIVTAGAPEVPPSLVAQLADGGRLVIPVGGHDEQTLTVIERTGPRTREVPRLACRFVKLIGREAWQEPEAPTDHTDERR